MYPRRESKALINNTSTLHKKYVATWPWSNAESRETEAEGRACYPGVKTISIHENKGSDCIIRAVPKACTPTPRVTGPISRGMLQKFLQSATTQIFHR